MNPTRDVPVAAVLASAVPAGTMASSSGNAIVAPSPRRNVRRGNELLARNIVTALLSCDSEQGYRWRALEAGGVLADGAGTARIWNGTLSTIPSTSDENR